MLGLDIILEGDGAWPDLGQLRDEGRLTWLRSVSGEPPGRLAMSALSSGMASGKPSVAIRVDLPDGRVIVVETSLTLLLTAADMFKARYGDPRK